MNLNHRAVLPEQLLALLARGDARLVRAAEALLSVVVEQLNAIQHEISTGRFRDLWDTPTGQPPTPKSEDEISDWLKSTLQTRMGNGILVDREIQVQRNRPRGIGTRIDRDDVAAAGLSVRPFILDISLPAGWLKHPQRPMGVSGERLEADFTGP